MTLGPDCDMALKTKRIFLMEIYHISTLEMDYTIKITTEQFIRTKQSTVIYNNTFSTKFSV